MAFVLQDDTGTVADANAYIDVAYFRTYHSDRGTLITVEGETLSVADASLSDDQIKICIVNATEYVDNSKEYQGVQLTDGQATQFPRKCLYDTKGNLVVGIFANLKKAVAEYGVLDVQGLLKQVPTVDASGLQITSKREKVGPLEEETTYAPGYASGLKCFPYADRLLQQFVCSGLGRIVRI